MKKSNNYYIKGNNFNIPLKLDRVSGLLLDKQISVSASLTNKLSGWECCIYQCSNTTGVEASARPQ